MNQNIHIKEGTQNPIQTLSINSNGLISISGTGLKFIDKDTKQHILYLPALEISGYGETIEKAWQMLDFSINEFCKYVRALKPKARNTFLVNLGWRHDIFSKKDFSKAFVDIDGMLNEFNALDNKIELVGLQAA